MSLTAPKPKPDSIHYKKRYGQHQKHTKRFKDTYWPYLPMLVIVLIGLFASSIWSGAAGDVLGARTGITASALLDKTNVEREKQHEPNLQLNSQLTTAAQAKANDMASRDYWSHTTPDGKQPWSFIAKVGYQYEEAGENLAYGFTSASATVGGWMNSTEHRANILNDAYQEVGFGVVTSPDYQGHGQQIIVVALYAEPRSSISLANAARPTASHQFANLNAPAQQVARVQLLSGQPWALLVVVAVATFAAGMFVMRHAIFWHRALVKSEAFIIKHHKLDLLFIGVAIIGVILSRTAGFIH